MIWTLGLALCLVSVPADAKRKRKRRRRARLPAQTQRLEPAKTVRGLVKNLRTVWNGPVLRRGQTAVFVAPAESGKPILVLHGDKKLNVASNVKLLSTATALDTLGPDWRFATRVYGTLPSPKGEVAGPIYVRGMADPTLGLASLEAMAKQIHSEGVRKIAGPVFVGKSEVRDALPSARLQIKVQGQKPGKPARISLTPAFPFVTIQNKTRTLKSKRSKLTVTAKRKEGSQEVVVTVTGRVGRGRTHTFLRTTDKANLFTARALHHYLSAQGIEVVGDVQTGVFKDFARSATENGTLPVPLAEVLSPPLSELVSRINKRSLNFLADRVISVTGAAAYGGDPSMALGVKAMNNWLSKAGITPTDLVVDTGSGLSYKTKISVKQIARILRVAGGYEKRPGIAQHAETYQSSLSFAGKDGTLRGRMGQTPARIIGKTGTLTSVIATSGFVHLGSRSWVFSIVTNGNLHSRRKRIRREHDIMVYAIADYLNATKR